MVQTICNVTYPIICQSLLAFDADQLPSTPRCQVLTDAAAIGPIWSAYPTIASDRRRW